MFTQQLVLALFALVAVSAYDFEDSRFNELLADRLEDWDFSARVRREVSPDDDDSDKFLKCKHHHGKTCCGKGRWLKHFGDKDKQAISDCFNDFVSKLNASGISTGGDPFSCARVNQMKMKVICTTECVAKKADLVDEDGALKLDKALSYMDKLELEDWQKPILEEAIKKCAPTANNTLVSTPNTGDIKCNPVLLSLQHCLFQEVEKNCPEDQKKTDGKCKKLFEKIKANNSS